MAKRETGMLAGRFPYILMGHGERLALVLPGSEEIMFGIEKFPWMFTRFYGPVFPPGYRVLIIGYGTIPEGKTPVDFAIDIGRAIKGKFSPDVVLGLSFGGLVTMSFGVVNPRVAKALVIVSAAHDLSPGGLETVTGWMDRSRTGVSLALFRSFISLFRRNRYRAAMKMGISLAWPVFKNRVNPSMYLVHAYEPALAIREKVKDFLPAMRKPTLVLAGSADQLFPEIACQELARLVPNAILELVAGETHTMLFEQQSACKERIKKFLDKALDGEIIQNSTETN